MQLNCPLPQGWVWHQPLVFGAGRGQDCGVCGAGLWRGRPQWCLRSPGPRGARWFSSACKQQPAEQLHNKRLLVNWLVHQPKVKAEVALVRAGAASGRAGGRPAVDVGDGVAGRLLARCWGLAFAAHSPWSARWSSRQLKMKTRDERVEGALQRESLQWKVSIWRDLKIRTAPRTRADNATVSGAKVKRESKSLTRAKKPQGRTAIRELTICCSPLWSTGERPDAAVWKPPSLEIRTRTRAEDTYAALSGLTRRWAHEKSVKVTQNCVEIVEWIQPWHVIHTQCDQRDGVSGRQRGCGALPLMLIESDITRCQHPSRTCVPLTPICAPLPAIFCAVKANKSVLAGASFWFSTSL